jgi:hypothetical protein
VDWNRVTEVVRAAANASLNQILWESNANFFGQKKYKKNPV